MRNCGLPLCLLLSLLLGQRTMGQNLGTDAELAVLAANTTQIAGADNPEAIPREVSFGHFLLSYRNWADSLALSDPDHQLLLQQALDEPTTRQQEYSSYVGGLITSCADIDTVDARVLAKRIGDISGNITSVTIGRYEAILAALTPAGRSAVEEFIAKSIVPLINYSTESNMGIAEQAPDYFKRTIGDTCEAYKSDIAALGGSLVAEPLGPDKSGATQSSSSASDVVADKSGQ